MANDKKKKKKKSELKDLHPGVPVAFGRKKLATPTKDTTVIEAPAAPTQAEKILKGEGFGAAPKPDTAAMLKSPLLGRDDITAQEAVQSVGQLARQGLRAPAGPRPEGGFGGRNLSGLYEGLVGKPEGTGKIQGIDEGPGVIRKMKGRAPEGAGTGYGEGRVFVPGTNTSYVIGTPANYAKGRREFIDKTRKTGSVPRDFQNYGPQAVEARKPKPATEKDAVPDTYADTGGESAAPAASPKAKKKTKKPADREERIFTPPEHRLEGGGRKTFKSLLGIEDPVLEKGSSYAKRTSQEKKISSEFAKLRDRTLGRKRKTPREYANGVMSKVRASLNRPLLRRKKYTGGSF